MLAFLIIANIIQPGRRPGSRAFLSFRDDSFVCSLHETIYACDRFRCRYDGSRYQKKGHVTCLISVFTTPPCLPSDAHVRRTWRHPTRTSLRRGLQVKVGGEVEQVQHYNMFFLKRSFMFQEIKTLLGRIFFWVQDCCHVRQKVR